ncbi:5-formyltetrahydrofolate cyclo-ligase [Reinekea forsetii]|nr:5-formyltetrahydrofolate cyclo-ligase [Reinekea forsetii]
MSVNATPNPSNTIQKVELRRRLRKARRSLSYSEQQTAANALVEAIRPQLSVAKTPRIAMYWAADGEISLKPLMEYCFDLGIEVYLPVLHPFKPRLWFAQYFAGAPLLNNHFGIPEPQAKQRIKSWQLSMVLLPLVGFDEFGGRIGMGGGFYDRTFAGIESWPHKPKLIGVAHECQKLEKVPLEPWDIELTGVVSDKQWYCVD